MNLTTRIFSWFGWYPVQIVVPTENFQRRFWWRDAIDLDVLADGIRARYPDKTFRLDFYEYGPPDAWLAGWWQRRDTKVKVVPRPPQPFDVSFPA